MTINDMWDFYDKAIGTPLEADILDLLNSIDDLYEIAFVQGLAQAQNMKVGKCFVYFITCEDAIKIGVANDVDKRLKQLKTGNLNKMNILKTIPFNTREDAFAEEKRLHKKYEFCRLGGEWFDKNTVIMEECIPNTF